MFDTNRQPDEKDVDYQARMTAEVAALETNADGRVILPLAYPIVTVFKRGSEEREETIEALTFRRPNGGDLRALDIRKPENIILLQRIERLSGLSVREIDKLDEADIERAGIVVSNFT